MKVQPFYEAIFHFQGNKERQNEQQKNYWQEKCKTGNKQTLPR